MLPVLVAIGPLKLYSYGLALFIAFFAGMYVIWKKGREAHFEEDELFDAVMIIILIALFLARIVYGLFRLDIYGFNVWNWVNVVGAPGFHMFGAMVGFGLATVWQAKRRKWDVYSLFDVLVIGLALAQAIMAVGAFLNGSGYGLPTEGFLGVRFAGLYERRLPVQLFDMVVYGSLFTFLWWVEKEYRTFAWYRGTKSQANSGFLTAAYMIGSGFFGFFFSFLRPVVWQIGPVRMELLLFLALFVGGLFVLYWRSGMNVSKGWGGQRRPLLSRNKKARKASTSRPGVTPSQNPYDISGDLF
jgi:prolipoprotein diacylglyceryltransferase